LCAVLSSHLVLLFFLLLLHFLPQWSLILLSFPSIVFTCSLSSFLYHHHHYHHHHHRLYHNQICENLQ
jgi:hypothetical protein